MNPRHSLWNVIKITKKCKLDAVKLCIVVKNYVLKKHFRSLWISYGHQRFIKTNLLLIYCLGPQKFRFMFKYFFLSTSFANIFRENRIVRFIYNSYIIRWTLSETFNFLTEALKTFEPLLALYLLNYYDYWLLSEL